MLEKTDADRVTIKIAKDVSSRIDKVFGDGSHLVFLNRVDPEYVSADGRRYGDVIPDDASNCIGELRQMVKKHVSFAEGVRGGYKRMFMNAAKLTNRMRPACTRSRLPCSSLPRDSMDTLTGSRKKLQGKNTLRWSRY